MDYEIASSHTAPEVRCQGLTLLATPAKAAGAMTK